MPAIPFDWHVLLAAFARIAFAYVLAVPTGWWREREGHAVGIRTFPMVAMASCGYMMVFGDVRGLDGMTLNSHILQGLVAGIGFIGGGAIVRDGANVRGTATAAAIWTTGAIGAAVALGRNEIAVVLAVLNVFTLEALIPVKKRLDSTPPEEGGE
jgi:putative Mg2+ transporter-C (MgtC) family protein